MNADDFARMIAAALEIAGESERGTAKGDRDELLACMDKHYVPADQADAVTLLFDAFSAFAQNVRAAERKRRPVYPGYDEGSLPQ